MAQTTYVYNVTGHGSGKGLVCQVGKMNFATADTTATLSTTIKKLVYCDLTRIKPTLTSEEVDDFLDVTTVSVANARTIPITRQAAGTSGMYFFYRLFGY